MDYKELFQAKLDELLELGTPLEEAEMQALEAMREALAGPLSMLSEMLSHSWVLYTVLP